MVSTALLGMMIFVFASQDNTSYWVTKTLRVQFQDRSGLGEYSGCFGIDANPDSISFSRRTYNSFDVGSTNISFGYCRRDRQWLLFRGKASDPCGVSKELELARSTKTDLFDISSSFDEPWVSPSNTPLDLYFFDGGSETELYDHCRSFLGDGVCDEYLNRFGYQYDGGDCCAATCTQSKCGNGDVSNPFGDSSVSADGFPSCIDSSMLPITIHLNEITSSRGEGFGVSDSLWFGHFGIAHPFACRNLFTGENEIRSIPTEIGLLSNLKELIVGGNSIALDDVPVEILEMCTTFVFCDVVSLPKF